ncbi:hypothetical protein HZH66_013605 [Vespula vulgaris]|uniref:Uncharacterized protein n=1 Tax=Vespula vulgaris TaxID=7454 RepID=A0A834MTB4_VESVU|nr:hypothetical protein HZH66_013605 [Vespula vulgaris]
MRLVRGEARARNHRDTTTVRTWDERSGGYGVRWSATREAEVTALRSNRHPVGEAPIETLMNRSLRFSGVSYIGTTLGYPDDGDAEEGREGRELSGGAGGRGEEGEGVRGGGGKW